MEQKEFWRGVEGVGFIWHGEWADPELRYGNIVANCVEVEMDLQAYTIGEIPDDDRYEERLTMWCREHRVEVIATMYLCERYSSKRCNFFDALDGGEIVFEDAIVIDGIFVKGISLDEDCRMWLHTIDDTLCELEQVSEFDKHSREFVRYYGGFETESALILAHAEQRFDQWLDGN